MSKEKITTLVLSGGGLKTIGLLGGLIDLYDKKLLDSLYKYAGSSAGSIIACLLVLGYTPHEIYRDVFDQDIGGLMREPMYMIPINLYKHYGLYSGDKVTEFLSTFFTSKGFSKDITFSELYVKTQKILVVTGTSLTKRDTYFFNYRTFPDMKVIDAIRISSGFPLFFTSKKLEIDEVEHIFIDGGLLKNFPLFYFDICREFGSYLTTYEELEDYVSKNVRISGFSSYKHDTIGLMLSDDKVGRNSFDYYTGTDTIRNFKDFIKSFIGSVFTKLDQLNTVDPMTGSTDTFFPRVISVQTSGVSSLDFDLSTEIKEILLKNGRDAVERFSEYI